MSGVMGRICVKVDGSNREKNEGESVILFQLKNIN